VAVLTNPASRVHGLSLAEAGAAARSLQLQLQVVEARGPGEFAGAIAAATKEHAGALVVLGDPKFIGERARLAELAAKSRLPVMAAQREYAEAGALMAYGANLRELFHRAAGYMDKILKGARPGDLPVEEPTKFELVVNLKTARALGVTIPPAILARADDVIQ
jgi:putative ABC transport system substrate-binding protein